MTTTILHISDTHFGTEVAAVVTALKQAAAGITPDVVILSGDITQRARPSQFRAAREFMDVLPAPRKITIPGNHDIPLFNVWSRILIPYRHYNRVFSTRESVWHNDEICIIGYDATCRWRHTRGNLLRQAVLKGIARARDVMKPGMILMACAHQPFLTAWPQDADEVLINAESTAQLFAENGVDIVLSGHVHVPLLTTTQDAFPTLPRHFVLAGAGTAISHRVRPGAPNQFNVIRCHRQDGNPVLEIIPYEYNPELKFFAHAVPDSFTLGNNGWYHSTSP